MTTVLGYTDSFRLPKITFAARGWHAEYNLTLDIIDAALDAAAAAVPVGAVGGTADAITLDFTPNVAYTIGQQISFIAASTNTGAVTVNCDSLGVKSLKASNGSALAAGNVAAGAYVRAIYDGTQFICIYPATVNFPNYIRTASSGATPAAAGDDFFVENSTVTGISILSGIGSTGNILFGRSTDNDAGQITYDHSTNAFTFFTNGTLVATLGSGGNLTVVGNVAAGGTVTEAGKNIGDVHVSTGTHSGASELNITLPSGYRTFELELSEIVPASTTNLSAKLSLDGTTYASSGYSSAAFTFAGTVGVGTVQTTYIVLSAGNFVTTATAQQIVKLTIDLPLTGSRDTRITGIVQVGTAAFNNGNLVDACAALGARPTHIRIYTGTGNFACTWRLIGKRN